MAKAFRVLPPPRPHDGAAVAAAATAPMHVRVSLPRKSGLGIAGTLQHRGPQPIPIPRRQARISRVWSAVPEYLKYAAAGVILLLALRSFVPGKDLRQTLENHWESIRHGIQERSTVELSDDFNTGLGAWQGKGNWAGTWSLDRAGFIRPGKLALFRPSVRMADYQLEFLAQIDRKSIGWVYRASDLANYYVTKISVTKPGLRPTLALVRYSVVSGKESAHFETPIRPMLHNDTPYRVRFTANGSGFSTFIDGQLVDSWTDEEIKSGGIGLFCERGERARVYWIKLSYQDDFVGRLCSQLAMVLQGPENGSQTSSLGAASVRTSPRPVDPA